jgi:VWFA-related protein
METSHRKEQSFIQRAVCGFGVLCLICAQLSYPDRLNSQDRPRESVTVTAVEIPVRVFDKNGFIKGLVKEDFEIFENGVKQEITGFEAVSRTISPVPVSLPGPVPTPPRKRNFVLIFNVFDYTPQIGEAIDYFFKNVAGSGDRLIVVVEDRIYDLDVQDSPEMTSSRLKEYLKKIKMVSRIEIGKVFMELDRRAEDIMWNGRSSTSDILNFYDYYKGAWLDYRARLLDVNLALYRTIVHKVESLAGEKWAVCFQQRDLFPRLKIEGRFDRAIRDKYERGDSDDGVSTSARMLIQDRQNDLKRSMDIADNLPAEAIRNLFAEANITFHLLLMKALTAMASNESQDFELHDVNENYEDVLRRISRATGGLTVFSNKVIDTLKEAAAKEDQYYMLVYQPKDKKGSLERKIDVKVRNKDADVVALKRYVGQKPPTISIAEFSTKSKAISFTVGNCAKIVKGGADTGKITVRITIFDENSVKVFNEVKSLDLVADSIHLSLNFEKVPAGNYFIVIEAVDLVNGEKDVLSRAIVL